MKRFLTILLLTACTIFGAAGAVLPGSLPSHTFRIQHSTISNQHLPTSVPISHVYKHTTTPNHQDDPSMFVVIELDTVSTSDHHEPFIAVAIIDLSSGIVNLALVPQSAYREILADSVNYCDPTGLAEVVHATTLGNVGGILKTGLKAGKDGLVWLSSPNVAGSGASEAATVHLKLDVPLEGAKDIPKEVIKNAEKAANAALKGKGYTGALRGKMWARAKWDEVAKWIMKQPGKVFKSAAPGQKYAGGTHYAVKGSLPAGSKLLEISGRGARGAAAASGGLVIDATTASQVARVQRMSRFLKGVQIGGRVLLVVAVAADSYRVYTAENRKKELIVTAGGWAGAWAGAKFGGWAGTKTGILITGVGGQLGPQAALPEEIVTVPLGAVVGGLIGSVGGGVAGYFSGRKTTKTVYEWAVEDGATLPTASH